MALVGSGTVISERIFTFKVSLQRSCSALNKPVLFFFFFFEIGSETTTWRVFEISSMLSVNRDHRSRKAEFKCRLWPWQPVFSTKCKKRPRIDSRKNELHSCFTGEEQLVSVSKTPGHDFASVLPSIVFKAPFRRFFSTICCAMKIPFLRRVFHCDRSSGC